MNLYDFQNLSPREFEILVQDLLQEEFKCVIEGFSEGKDFGIDLRFNDRDGRNVIVQCKRYQKWSNLLYALQFEKEKVKRLNPDRYYCDKSRSFRRTGQSNTKNF
ncbi:restriction endonuclease [Chitinophaga sp. sic0106]|uniref:restriction endonuclease n=1 Tax=Chitinophaga sp. sic0106 TaxID=2854785 RepID=UPI001C483295|nr:restriction endonuclease [Chitinophaga sp. sic0106]